MSDLENRSKSPEMNSNNNSDEILNTGTDTEKVNSSDKPSDNAPIGNEKTNEQFESEKSERLTQLPLARIRTLIKADQDVTIASQESVFLIAKATELFVETVAKEMHRVTHGQKRKTIYRKDMDAVIETMDEYAFLEGALD